MYEKETDSKGVPLLKRVERYPELPDDVFVPIIYQEIEDFYKINKKGEIFNTKTKAIIKGTITTKNYRQSSMSNINGKRKYYRIHRLVGFTFLLNPNSNTYNVVNHINSDTLDTNLSNLEIVTITTNNNHSKKKFIKKHKNKNKTIETDKLIGYSGNINDYVWYKHWKYENIFICKEGFIAKFNNKTKKLKRIGSITSENYIRIHLNKSKTSIGAHRIIMEFLLNRELRDGEIVDHINCIRYDNKFENLRITDNIGNMNNPLTLNKYYRKAILADLYGDFIMYNHSKNLHKFIYKNYNKNGAKQDPKIGISISDSIKYTVLADKYFLIDPLNKQDLYRKMEIVIYVFSDKDKTKIIGAFDSIRDTSRKLNVNRDVIKYRLNKNIPDKLGRYYMRGSEAVKLVISLGHGTAANFQPEDTK